MPPAASTSSVHQADLDVQDGPKVKRTSQRPSLSCTECARRKTKCDKNVPCNQCIKRAKTHLCRVEQNGASKDLTVSSAPPVVTGDPTTNRQSIFGEVSDIRVTVDLLRSRLSGLEALLATTLVAQPPPPPGATPSAASQPTFTHPLPPTSEQSQSVYDPNQPTYSNGVTIAYSAERHSSTEGGLDEAFTQAAKGKQAEEELEASVALEFLALGRHRQGTFHEQPLANGDQQVPTNLATDDVRASAPSAPNYPPSPTQLFPTTASLAAALPPQPQADQIIMHSVVWLGWHHSAIHAPSFAREVAEFWSWGERRVELANPAWLALLFAVLTVGVTSLAPGQHAMMGLSEGDQAEFGRRWFEASLACLYRANFIQSHTIFSVQTICVLVVSGQDAAGSNLIPTLLAIGISSSQELGLHRLMSDEDWEKSVRDTSPDVRVKSLIGREMRKRMFWSLVAQDWFSVAWKRTYIVSPTQVTTPLPANAHDEDLLTGRLVNRPPDQYTVVSKLLLWVQIARCLQSVFEHIDANASPSYEFLLSVDQRLNSILNNAPAWLRHDGPTIGMPPCYDWVRTTYLISSNHKMLTLHRPFLAHAFRDPRYEISRRRAINASRTILREAARCAGNIFHLWTIPYHISAAACVVLLDLFQRAGSSSASLNEERSEVLGALSALESMQETSSVARRGVALITNLVTEEGRLREERARTVNGHSARGTKRQAPPDSGGEDYTTTVKKMALSEIVSPPASTATTPSDHLSQSPHYFNGASSTTSYPQFKRPSSGPSFAPNDLTAPSPHSVGSSEPALYDNTELPIEFMSVFTESGMDLGLGLQNAFGAMSGGSAGGGGGIGGAGGTTDGQIELEPYEIDSHFLGEYTNGASYGVNVTAAGPPSNGLPWM